MPTSAPTPAFTSYRSAERHRAARPAPVTTTHPELQRWADFIRCLLYLLLGCLVLGALGTVLAPNQTAPARDPATQAQRASGGTALMDVEGDTY